MTLFTNGFPTFGEKSCDPERWKPYFCNYNKEQWLAEGDGVLSFETDDGLLYSLTISHWAEYGFLLEYGCEEVRSRKQQINQYAISDPNTLSIFVEQDDLMYPKGCFLPPEMAWLVVEDFLNHTHPASVRVKWIAGDDIEWPDDLY